ncbi:MAG: hypothetical protein K9N52_06595 [Verrucomicrobia bacterium]|nr:hypothetical protein [Verrucomicrobiota bacterium]
MMKLSILHTITVCALLIAPRLSAEISVDEFKGALRIQNGRASMVFPKHKGEFRISVDGRVLINDFRVEFAGATSTTGYIDYNKQRFTDNTGRGMKIDFRLYTGRRMRIFLYDNEPLLVISAMDKQGAGGKEIKVQGRFSPQAPSRPVIWKNSTADAQDGSSPSIELLRESTLTGRYVMAAYLGNELPALVTGMAGGAEMEPEFQISRAGNSLTFTCISPKTPGGESAPIAVYFGADVFEGMEKYGRLFLNAGGRIPSGNVPCGVDGTALFGNSINQDRILYTAERIIQSDLREYGFNLINLGTSWRLDTPAPWTLLINRRYPAGLLWLTEQLHRRGLYVGIGYSNNSGIPSAGVTARPGSAEPLSQTPLPLVAESTMIARGVTYDWVCDYLEFPTGPRQTDPIRLRKTLSAMKTSSRPGTYLAVSCSNPWPVAGVADGAFLDGSRTSETSDVGLRLGRAARLSSLWFIQNRMWINHTRPVTLSPPLTDGQARIRAALCGMSGGPLLSGDLFWELEDSRLALLKTITPPTGKAARPLDLFERTGSYPQKLALKIEKPWGDYWVVCLINLESASAMVEVDFAQLPGAGSNARLIGYDFWNKNPAGTFTNGFSAEVPANDCLLMSLAPLTTHPTVISTSRHFTQGGFDLNNIAWNKGQNRLTGLSTGLVPGDKYSITIYHPSEYAVSSIEAEAEDFDISRPSDEVTTIGFNPNKPVVKWSILFKVSQEKQASGDDGS